MSGILDRAKAHYDGLDSQKIRVPEWGSPKAPLIITFTPLTVAQRRKIYKADDKGKSPDGGTVCVRAVILKACDEAGRRLFDDMAEHDLTHSVDADVVGRIADAILFRSASLGSSVEETIEAEKNA